MGTKWEQSGNKNSKVGQEWEQSGNKVGARTPKWGKNGNKVGTRIPKWAKNGNKVGHSNQVILAMQSNQVNVGHSAFFWPRSRTATSFFQILPTMSGLKNAAAVGNSHAIAFQPLPSYNLNP